MSKYFRPWKIDEPLLLPASVQDFVAKGHLSRFVLELVRESLDLTEITGSYVSEFGQPPFDPLLMVALLLYTYCCGIYAVAPHRQGLPRAVDFMSIVGLDAPDFRTVSDFRKRHLKALGALFLQILQLCETAGLVKLGHVALDGTKIKANASKHKAMSYERMEKRGRGAGSRGRQHGWRRPRRAMPRRRRAVSATTRPATRCRIGSPTSRNGCAERIRKAKAALEAEAKAAAEAKLGSTAEAEQQREAEGRKKPGRQAGAPPSEEPDAKAQTQLHRSGEPDHEEQGRLRSGLQRPGRRRRRAPRSLSRTT